MQWVWPRERRLPSDGDISSSPSSSTQVKAPSRSSLSLSMDTIRLPRMTWRWHGLMRNEDDSSTSSSDVATLPMPTVLLGFDSDHHNTVSDELSAPSPLLKERYEPSTQKGTEDVLIISSPSPLHKEIHEPCKQPPSPQQSKEEGTKRRLSMVPLHREIHKPCKQPPSPQQSKEKGTKRHLSMVNTTTSSKKKRTTTPKNNLPTTSVMARRKKTADASISTTTATTNAVDAAIDISHTTTRQQCPICGKEFTGLFMRLNEHIDECLRLSGFD